MIIVMIFVVVYNSFKHDKFGYAKSFISIACGTGYKDRGEL